MSPARSPYAITVGATNIADKEAIFSNYGVAVDLLAPGVDIISAAIDHRNVGLMLVII